LELRGLRSSDRFPGPLMPFQDVEVARAAQLSPTRPRYFLNNQQPFPDEKID